MEICVLLSIKPEFVDRIFDGSKLFEFRRKVFRDRSVKTIVVYATAPVSQVVGEFDIEEIIEGDVIGLWELTKEHSGIAKEHFDKYFSGLEIGFAIRIGETRIYDVPLDLNSEFSVMHPPQSFIYIRQ